MFLKEYQSDLDSYQKTLAGYRKKLIIVFLIFWMGFVLDIIKRGDNFFFNFLFLSVLTAVVFAWFKRYTEKLLERYKNTESIIFLFKEIENRIGFDSKKTSSLDKYYKNTIAKYDKEYHTKKHSTLSGMVIFAESDLGAILNGVIEADINIANDKYRYFNKTYIHKLISKIKSNEEYHNKAFDLELTQMNRRDKMLETFAKGQGISKEELYDNLESKREKIVLQNELNEAENERIDKENQRNAAFVLSAGTCPFCKSKISKYVTKCPVCTGDLYQKRKG